MRWLGWTGAATLAGAAQAACRSASAPASGPVSALAPTRPSPGPAPSPATCLSAGQPWHRIAFVGDPLMDGRILHYLGHAWWGGSDISECLDTATRIRPGDERSWFDAWLATARRLQRDGDDCLARGRDQSGGETLLRAANYYRAALIHYSTRQDPRVLEATRASAAAFERALVALRIPARQVRIPYEGSSLPGTFLPSSARGPRPCLLVMQGWDAWPEETLHLALGAVRRGYHCLLFHGPGQGRALREHGLVFRHDWERVVTPVGDVALALPGVDPRRLILVGNSFGGALGPRAVAFEHRISTCVANPGTLNWFDAIERGLAEYGELGRMWRAQPDRFDAAVREIIASDAPGGPVPLATFRWWVRATMWKHGASGPADLMRKLSAYRNEPVVERIRCRVLVIDGEGEEFTPGQARALHDALRCPKDFLLFTGADTGLLHCQTGATAVATRRIFDWLDQHA